MICPECLGCGWRPYFVETLEGEELVWLYVLAAYEGGLPSASYLSVISEAALAAGAPDDYVHDLRTRPCRSVSE